MPVSSVPRAAAFYAAVFGWQCEDTTQGWPSKLPGVSTVHLFQSPKVPSLHGSFSLMPGVDIAGRSLEGRVVMTFNVDSIEETLQVVEKEGGKVVL